jgi:hypothetical protein
LEGYMDYVITALQVERGAELLAELENRHG